MVDLLPAPLGVDPANVSIPRLTCGDAQRPWWFEVYVGNGCILFASPKLVTLQRISLRRVALRCKVFQKSMRPSTALEPFAERSGERAPARDFATTRGSEGICYRPFRWDRLRGNGFRYNQVIASADAPPVRLQRPTNTRTSITAIKVG
jgi:hypothetical protein